MGWRGSRLKLLAFLSMMPALPLGSEQPALVPKLPHCIPPGSNAPVQINVSPAEVWESVRVYFRKANTEHFYFVEAKPFGAEGAYVAVLPKPKPETVAVEVFVRAVHGQAGELNSEPTTLQVRAGCGVSLSPQERELAATLVVGETDPSQRGTEVLGFQCEGITARLTAQGELIADEYCRKAVVGKDDKHKVLLPLILTGAGAGAVAIIRHQDKEEASPFRP